MRNRKLWFYGAALSAVAALTLSACGQDGSAQGGLEKIVSRLLDESSDSGAMMAADGDAQYADEALGVMKHNIYVALNRDIIGVTDNLLAYYEAVEDEDEFRLAADVSGAYNTAIQQYSTDSLDEALVVASQEPGYGRIDEVVKEIEKPMRTLIEVFNALAIESGLEDNGYAKAKEYHTKIRGVELEFIALSSELKSLEDERVRQSIAEEERSLLDDNRKVQYGLSHMITVTKELLDFVSDRQQEDGSYALTGDELRPFHEQLKQTVEGYQTAAADTSQLEAESLIVPPLIGVEDELLASVEMLIKRLDAGEVLIGADDEPGSLSYMVDQMNHCIDAYNDTFTE